MRNTTLRVCKWNWQAPAPYHCRTSAVLSSFVVRSGFGCIRTRCEAGTKKARSGSEETGLSGWGRLPAFEVREQLTAMHTHFYYCRCTCFATDAKRRKKEHLCAKERNPKIKYAQWRFPILPRQPADTSKAGLPRGKQYLII